MPKQPQVETKNSEQEWKFGGFTFPTTTPVPDQFFDELLFRLNPSETKVLLYIIRRTFGFRKPSDNISLSQLCNGIITKEGRVLDRGTGLSKASVARALKSLEAKDVIKRTRRSSRERGDQATTYELNFLTPVSQIETRGVSPVRQGVSHQRDTQQTVLQQTDIVVVDRLEEYQIEKEKAQELVRRFSPEYIGQKVDLLEWKLDPETKTRGRRIQDPAAWLIRAIERDYKPPPAFKTKAQREKEAEELAHEQVELQRRRQEFTAEKEQEKAQRLEELKRKYGTTQRELDLWPQVLKDIESRMTKASFQTWFSETALLSVEDGQALIGAPNQMAREWIENRLRKVVERSMASLGYEVELEVEVM